MSYTKEQRWKLDAKCAELMGWTLHYKDRVGGTSFDTLDGYRLVGNYTYVVTWSPTTSIADAIELADHLGISITPDNGQWLAGYLYSTRFDTLEINVLVKNESPCMAIVLTAIGESKVSDLLKE